MLTMTVSGDGGEEREGGREVKRGEREGRKRKKGRGRGGAWRTYVKKLGTMTSICNVSEEGSRDG